jgi:predicted nucleic acid-binding protein
MIVVDSSVWIDFFRGRFTPQVETLGGLLDDGLSVVAVPDLVLFEVLRGFRSPQDYQVARRLFAPLGVVEVCGEALALQAADHYRVLRRLGITIASPIGVLLGSFCIEQDMALLHSDADFGAMEEHCGLKVLRH